MLGKRLHGVIFNEATIDSNPYYGYLNQSYLASDTKKKSEAGPSRNEEQAGVNRL